MADSRFHAAQSLGAREKQEDAWCARTRDGENQPYLVVVADGMGGHAAGEVASGLAARTFVESYESQAAGTPPQRLRAALDRANDAVLDRIAEQSELEGMGTTLVAMVNEPGGLYFISVGDSPLWRAAGGELRRVNQDHSMRTVLEGMAASGELTSEEAARHPHRNRLRSALGDEEIELVDCPDEPLSLAPSEVLLAATDGIETLPEPSLSALMVEAKGEARAAVESIITAIEAAAAPRQDNSTVCVWTPEPPSPPAVAAPAGEPSEPPRGAHWRRALLPLVMLAAALALIGASAVLLWRADVLRRDPPAASTERGREPGRTRPAPPPAAPDAATPPRGAAVEREAPSTSGAPAPEPRSGTDAARRPVPATRDRRAEPTGGG